MEGGPLDHLIMLAEGDYLTLVLCSIVSTCQPSLTKAFSHLPKARFKSPLVSDERSIAPATDKVTEALDLAAGPSSVLSGMRRLQAAGSQSLKGSIPEGEYSVAREAAGVSSPTTSASIHPPANDNCQFGQGLPQMEADRCSLGEISGPHRLLCGNRGDVVGDVDCEDGARGINSVGPLGFGGLPRVDRVTGQMGQAKDQWKHTQVADPQDASLALERLSIKMHGVAPESLPSDLRQRLSNWVGAADAQLLQV
jgi:hypothetical protein